jgi:glutathione S-transferase
MTEVIVHGVPGSPYVRSVLLELDEKSAPYGLTAMDMGEGKTPKQLARQPFGRIPVIDLADFQLYETQAILRCVDAVFPGAPL